VLENEKKAVLKVKITYAVEQGLPPCSKQRVLQKSLMPSIHVLHYDHFKLTQVLSHK
jgi:hypothetical protein